MANRVLVVDDDVALGRALAEHLSNEGFRVDCACEREEAEAMMSFVPYELLITDLCLTPFGCDGLEVLDFTWHRTPRPKVIVLTGSCDPLVEYEALFRGGDLFLRKPLPLQRVAEEARRMVGTEGIGN